MQIGITYDPVHTHTTLALGRLFGEDVTSESFLMGDLTGTGNFKALLGAAVGFNLWHYITVFKLLPAGGSEITEHLIEPCGKCLKKKYLSLSGGKGMGKWGEFEGFDEVFNQVAIKTAENSLFIHSLSPFLCFT